MSLKERKKLEEMDAEKLLSAPRFYNAEAAESVVPQQNDVNVAIAEPEAVQE